MLTSFTVKREHLDMTAIMAVDLEAMDAKLTLIIEGKEVGSGRFNPSWFSFETPEGVDRYFDTTWTKFEPGVGYYEEARIHALYLAAQPQPQAQQVAA